jgi:hypothetical protein
MKLALIASADVLLARPNTGYHMVLAQKAVEDPKYLDYYRTMRDLGHFIMVDNGAAELGQSFDFEAVCNVAEELKADEVAMPDALGKSEVTLALTASVLDLIPPKSRMMIPQGENWIAWTECLTQMVAWGCSTIGIPKLYEGYAGGRWNAVDIITLRGYHLTHNIHYLGCHHNPVKETRWAYLTKVVRGIDTAAPFAYAQVGEEMDCGVHYGYEWGEEIPYLHAAKVNVGWLLSICNRGDPDACDN